MAVIEAQSTPDLRRALIAGATIGFLVVFAIVCAALLLAGAAVNPPLASV